MLITEKQTVALDVVSIENPIIRAYQKEDWGNLPNFTGNYINFGYWKTILAPDENRKISSAERTASAEALYALTAKALAIRPTDKILELGCGRGVGALFVAKQYHPKQLVGIDITSKQIELANLLHSETLRKQHHVFFQNTTIDSLIGHFNKALSVEVFQHIEKTEETLASLEKRLISGGLVAINTYFLCQPLSLHEMKKHFPLVCTQQEHLMDITHFVKLLKKTGFTDINVTAIGEHVFHGYDQWNHQQFVDTACSYVYYNNFQRGILDYYLISARKS